METMLKTSDRMLKHQVSQLPHVADVVPEFVRRNSAMLFITSSIWLSAVLFAYTQPLAFWYPLPSEAWGVISAVCGVLGTLVTTWLVKRYDARISERTRESTTQQELLKETIDWALKERAELFRETEAAYKKMLESREQEIDRLKAHLEAVLQEVAMLRKKGE